MVTKFSFEEHRIPGGIAADGDYWMNLEAGEKSALNASLEALIAEGHGLERATSSFIPSTRIRRRPGRQRDWSHMTRQIVNQYVHGESSKALVDLHADPEKGQAMEYSFHTHRITGGIGADDRYWESLEEGEFRLPQCAGCKGWMWPAHFRCGECGSWEQIWEPVELTGSIYSWTRSWLTFDRTSERTEDLPYTVILAEILGADGVRVLGVLDGPDEKVRVGAAIRGHIDPPSAKSKGYAAVRWTVVAA